MIDSGRLTHAATVASVVIVVTGAMTLTLLAEREEPVRVPSTTLSESGSERRGN